MAGYAICPHHNVCTTGSPLVSLRDATEYIVTIFREPLEAKEA